MPFGTGVCKFVHCCLRSEIGFPLDKKITSNCLIKTVTKLNRRDHGLKTENAKMKGDDLIRRSNEG